MIKHNLTILGSGHDPKPELNDFEVVHILYRLETMEIEGANNVTKYATTGIRAVDLDPWNVENRVPGAEVSKETLMQWLEAKVDVEALKLENVANLQPK